MARVEGDGQRPHQIETRRSVNHAEGGVETYQAGRAPCSAGSPARPYGCRESPAFREGAIAVSASNQAPRLLSVASVAKRLQVSTKTVRRWIETGVLRVHRLGRCVRISETDLQEFLDQRRQ